MRAQMAAIALILASCATVGSHSVEPVEPRLIVPGKIVEVYDGDTLTAEITLRVRVRLLDCWAPEVRSRDPEEKRRGRLSKANLWRIGWGEDALIEVPIASAARLDDVLTFGRVLAHVYVDGKSLAAEQVKAGHATREKQ